MFRPLIICSLATLLVCSSASPKFRESNVEDPGLQSFEYGEYVRGNLDTLDQEDVVVAKEMSYRNSAVPSQEFEAVGWWWDSKGVHNLTVGYRTYQDRLLYSANVYKPYKVARVVEQDVTVTSAHGERVSYIEAYDLHSDKGDAGYASIIGGGPGTNSVKIHLRSARNHGLKYYVRVFGHF